MTSGRGNFKMALASVRSTKWRSLLTMLGVIIGIVSVVTIVGIGEGVKHQVTDQANHFGKDLITVRPGKVHSAVNKEVVTNSDVLFGRNSSSGLTIQDVEAVKKADHVTQVAPLGTISGLPMFDGRKVDNIQVYATGSDLASILSHKVEYGSFFTSDPDANDVVIGANVATKLFNERVPLGQTFVFRGQSMMVRGMFERFHASPLSPTAGFDDAIFMPYQLADRLSNGGLQFYSILAKPTDHSQAKPAIAAVEQQMNKVRNGADGDFSVLDSKSSIAAGGATVDVIATFITVVAVIALLVGGIGIMNIMLLSVTERMHEIGIRKAIGATNRQILSQFMLEAAVLSGVGGVLGVVTSFFLAWFLRTYTDYQPIITWQPVLIATCISVAVGVIFGTAPAIKAARKDPIEALRHE